MTMLPFCFLWIYYNLGLDFKTVYIIGSNEACSGWPSSGWPQVGGTLTKKSKLTKLLDIVLCYTKGVVAYDPVLFGGCIPPPLTPLQVKPEALILISIGGRTLQCGVMYIFMFLCYQNWLLSPTVELASQEAYKTTQKRNKNVSFYAWN